MQRKLPRWMHGPVVAAWVLGGVLLVFGYHGSGRHWCSECWASMYAGEFGLWCPGDLQLPLWRTEGTDGEAEPGIMRFLPADHVHAIDGRGVAEVPVFPLCSTTDCRRTMPSEFAMALWDPPFADFVAARVEDGTVDVATVRALIAVPSYRRRDDAWVGARLDLLRKGAELHAAFEGTDSRLSRFWGVDVYDWPPPARGCPLRPPR